MVLARAGFHHVQHVAGFATALLLSILFGSSWVMMLPFHPVLCFQPTTTRSSISTPHVHNRLLSSSSLPVKQHERFNFNVLEGDRPKKKLRVTPQDDDDDDDDDATITKTPDARRPHPSSSCWPITKLAEVSSSSSLIVALVISIGSSTALLPSSDAAHAFVSTDVVDRVVDGDTVLLRNSGTRLRMIGMNTPETVSAAQREQGAPPDCYGPEASAFTKQVLPAGTAVRLETDVEPVDKFGRNLAYVFRTSDNMFVNGELVKQGYARQKTYGKNAKYEDLLRNYENEARTAKRGLWGSCDASTRAASSKSPTAASAVASSAASSATTKTPIQSKKTNLENPGDVKNCRDFSDYKQAKAWYDQYFELYGDVARLDGDGDGIPCESLPGAPLKKSKSK